MSENIFQRLSNSEHRSLMSQLEFAIENHAKWLAGINRSLICNSPPDTDDIDETPHFHCLLGRWYYDIEDPYISEQEAYLELGRTHRIVHQLGKELLLKKHRQEPITRTDYNQFIDVCEELRDQARQLYDQLKSDLYISSMLLGNIFENATEGVLVTTPDTIIINVNNAFSRLTGYTREEVLGKTPNILYSGRQDSTFYQKMWETLQQQGYWQGEIWNRRKNGDVYLEWLSISAIRNEAGHLTHYLAIFSDITEERKKEEQLYRLAHYDALTGLPNRMLFRDRLNQAINHARRNGTGVGLMFLDLDGFKKINDHYGHDIGDKLLQLVGSRLTTLLRTNDSIGRYGGDEFTILINQTNRYSDIELVARKVIESMNEPFEIDGISHHTSTSIGISFFPEHSQKVDELFKYADDAMYQAKRMGKNTYHVYGSPK